MVSAGLEQFRFHLTYCWRPFRPQGFVCRDTGLKACALCGRAFSPLDATN